MQAGRELRQFGPAEAGNAVSSRHQRSQDAASCPPVYIRRNPLARRFRPARPSPANPTKAIAHVDGSGTAFVADRMLTASRPMSAAWFVTEKDKVAEAEFATKL